MKISKLIAGTATILLLLSSCSSSKTEGRQGQQISVDVKQQDSYDHFFQKGYKAIPLATSDEILIGEITKLQLTDNCIYVFDKMQKAVFAFDANGYFLRKYRHVGQGEGEYSYLSDFQVYNGYLYLLSGSHKCIYQYTLDDQFVRKINVGDWYDQFQILNDKDMLLYSNFSNNKLYNIIWYDYRKERIEDKYFPFKQNDSYSLYFRVFHEDSKGKLLITQPYDHAVYGIADGKIKKSYAFSFNTSDKITENTADVSLYQMHTELRFKSIIKSFDCITQIDSTLYFIYVLDFYSYIAKVDLQTGKTYNAKLEIQEEYPFAYNPPITFYKNKGISVINAEEVLGMGKESFLSDKNPDGLLHEDDNPVIFIRELK